jgi:predicted alpha/beta-hydrolase family hydrolase
VSPKKPNAALLLAPGASATRDHATLVALDERLSAEGIVVERIDLPPRPKAAVPAALAAAEELAARTKLPANRVALGGRSYGGRMCSMAVAEGFDALALVLLSYPLHPPGKPDQLRTEHFPQLALPCLFVSGTRDSFASPDELRRATKAIPGKVSLAFLEGGDHGMRRFDAAVCDLVARAFQKFI